MSVSTSLCTLYYRELYGVQGCCVERSGCTRRHLLLLSDGESDGYDHREEKEKEQNQGQFRLRYGSGQTPRGG